jgi:hypothetical protein
MPGNYAFMTEPDNNRLDREYHVYYTSLSLVDEQKAQARIFFGSSFVFVVSDFKCFFRSEKEKNLPLNPPRLKRKQFQRSMLCDFHEE